MRALVSGGVLVAAVVAHAPAALWNNTGHKIVAAIAYLSLTPATRQRVDSLLRRHPDFATLRSGLSPSSSNFGLIVFTRAATWPDLIKGDPRFYNAERGDPPTPTLPGFPDMEQHRKWHFRDEPISQTRLGLDRAPQSLCAIWRPLQMRGCVELGDDFVRRLDEQMENLSAILVVAGYFIFL